MTKIYIMKELNRFRQFLNEDQMKNLAKLLRDEADQPDNKVGKSIFLKYAAQAEKTDVKDIKSLLGKLEDELIAKHPDTFSGEDDIVGSFLSTSKNYTVQENDLHEGTWALGSVAEMVKVMGKLEQIRKMGAAKGSIELENMDTALYNVFGDDEFSDAIDAAKGTDDDDRFNNFIGDAQARAKELLDSEVEYRKERGETGMEFKPRFGLEENDAVLDEILGEEKEEVNEAPAVFAEIDQMIGSIKDQMDPDDAFDSLVSEFEAISGGTRLLHQALKNITLDNNLMEKKTKNNV